MMLYVTDCQVCGEPTGSDEGGLVTCMECAMHKCVYETQWILDEFGDRAETVLVCQICDEEG